MPSPLPRAAIGRFAVPQRLEKLAAAAILMHRLEQPQQRSTLLGERLAQAALLYGELRPLDVFAVHSSIDLPALFLNALLQRPRRAGEALQQRRIDGAQRVAIDRRLGCLGRLGAR